MLKCGVPLVFSGVALLLLGYPTHLNDHNAWLLSCVVVVAVGAVLSVVAMKHRGRY